MMMMKAGVPLALVTCHSCVDGLRARLKPGRFWFDSRGWHDDVRRAVHHLLWMKTSATKVCATCGKRKPRTAFNKKKNSKSGLQGHCKDCGHTKFAAYYAKNKEHHLQVIKRNKRRRLEEVHKKVLEYFSEHPCVDCGEEDPIVLEFDHVRGRKRASVSALIRGACWERVLDEIRKCLVRCANCHRRITYTKLNSYRLAAPS